MPIYEYECRHCGNHLDQLQKINDAPLTKCPSCHKEGLRRLMSRTSFQLKGSGWYVTDFKDKPNEPKPAQLTEQKTAPKDSKDPKDPKKAEGKKESSAPPAK